MKHIKALFESTLWKGQISANCAALQLCSKTMIDSNLLYLLHERQSQTSRHYSITLEVQLNLVGRIKLAHGQSVVGLVDTRGPLRLKPRSHFRGLIRLSELELKCPCKTHCSKWPHAKTSLPQNQNFLNIYPDKHKKYRAILGIEHLTILLR